MSSDDAHMPGTSPPQRDVMYCHQCENEWYRDEHGLTCPECASDFTEVIEEGHDPRVEDEEEDLPQFPHHGEQFADDPEEEDINNIRWENNGPGEPLRGTYHRAFTLGGEQQAQQGLGGGFMGIVGSLLQHAMGGSDQHQQPSQQQEQPRQQEAGQQLVPGSPQVNNFNGTTIRHYRGANYSVTMTSTTTTGGNLHPRNANGPQPLQNQPDHINQILGQMMMNIGAVGGHGGQGQFGAVRMGPNGPLFGDETQDHTGPIGFQHILQLLGGARSGILGDAVLSDEALDQVMTRLMEQHTAGNAPGPATEDAIKALPTKQISKEDLDDNGKADCSICMDEVQLGDTVTVLPCKHWFHFDCVKAWLGEHDTCPHCRQGIMPREGTPGATSGPRSPDQPPLNDMNSPQATRPASSANNGMFARMRNTFTGNNSGTEGSSGQS
nr:putative ring finger protein p32a8.03c [Quercus suber]